MHARLYLSFLLLLGLFMSQFATAHHSAVHMDHLVLPDLAVVHADFSDRDSDHREHSPAEHTQHLCPECVLSHVLQAAFFHSVFPVIHLEAVKESVFIPSDELFVPHLTTHYSPRAPPILSVLI